MIRRLGWGLFYGALVLTLLLLTRPAWAQPQDGPLPRTQSIDGEDWAADQSRTGLDPTVSRALVKIVPGDRTRHVTTLSRKNLEMDELEEGAESPASDSPSTQGSLSGNEWAT